jgi:omega-amidase
MRAHLVQSEIVWEDKPANRAWVAGALERAQREGIVREGDLVVLPELFDTGFSFRLDVTSDDDETTLKWIQQEARRLGITLQGSRTVRGGDGKGRNRVSVAGPDGQVICEYDKVHPFSIGSESQYFTGGEAVKTYEWNDGADKAVVCPVICYDLRFPELFRRGMKMGAEVFAVVANWPGVRSMHRLTLSRARAIENQACVLSVNRCGRDPHLVYDGGTAAFDAKGEIIPSAPGWGGGGLVRGSTAGELNDQAGILSVEIDIAALRAWRGTFPALRDAKWA